MKKFILIAHAGYRRREVSTTQIKAEDFAEATQKANKFLLDVLRGEDSNDLDDRDPEEGLNNLGNAHLFEVSAEMEVDTLSEDLKALYTAAYEAQRKEREESARRSDEYELRRLQEKLGNLQEKLGKKDG